jgi:type II secretory pathway pseudopilin PulG
MLTAILKPMKKGGFRKANWGFTIAETMIVLAVTGAMFVAAVMLIGGRTAKTQFTTASNNLKQELEQIINETASGYFPNQGNFSCTPGVGGAPILANGSQSQGTNGGCVFLGKVVQFGASDVADNYITYAVAGNRLQNGTNQEVTTLAQAYPVAIAPGVSNNASLTGVTIQTPFENGLTIGKLTYNGSTATAGFALLTTLANYSAGGSSCNGVCSSSQGLSLYAIAGTDVNAQTSKGFVDILDSGAATYVPVSQVTICVNSGTTKQSALYTIGDAGSSQSVTLTVQSGSCP